MQGIGLWEVECQGSTLTLSVSDPRAMHGSTATTGISRGALRSPVAG